MNCSPFFLSSVLDVDMVKLKEETHIQGKLRESTCGYPIAIESSWEENVRGAKFKHIQSAHHVWRPPSEEEERRV